jgi:BON domain
MYTRSNLKGSARSIYSNNDNHKISVAAVGIILTMLMVSVPLRAFAEGSTVLMHRVDRALRANDNLNGAMCYSPAPGVIVLYGKGFDSKDRDLAEATAENVRGVTQVVNTLRTMTGQWRAEEERINDTLLLNGLEGVSARVIGSQVYLSGTVTGQAEKQRAARVVASVSNLQQNNFIWVKPGPIFQGL